MTAPTPEQLEALLNGPKKPVTLATKILGTIIGASLIAVALAMFTVVVLALVWTIAEIGGSL